MKKLMVMVLMAAFVVAITNCTVSDPKHSQNKEKSYTNSKGTNKGDFTKKGGKGFGHRKYWKIIKIPSNL